MILFWVATLASWSRDWIHAGRRTMVSTHHQLVKLAAVPDTVGRVAMVLASLVSAAARCCESHRCGRSADKERECCKSCFERSGHGYCSLVGGRFIDGRLNHSSLTLGNLPHTTGDGSSLPRVRTYSCVCGLFPSPSPSVWTEAR